VAPFSFRQYQAIVDDFHIDGAERSLTELVVAVLGLGEAGGRLAADLASAGVEVRGYDPASASTPRGVERFGDPGSAVSGASIVLALTTAATALTAAEAALSNLGDGAIYADLNTASPALKREVADLVTRSETARFADVALLGPIPERGLQAPVLASGVGARMFAEVFVPFGMPVLVISEEPGDAAAMKLVRSVFMKGLAAAAVESMQAAEALGRREWLAEEIEKMIGLPFLERALEGSRMHAVRRVDEMEAARELLLELGVEPHIATASAAQLADLSTARER
jgi:3-hydroxyisobutyrate dehydrogenase-like beta-hydroxyacid dehydrogenase